MALPLLGLLLRSLGLTWRSFFCAMVSTFTLNVFRTGVLEGRWDNVDSPGTRGGEEGGGRREERSGAEGRGGGEEKRKEKLCLGLGLVALAEGLTGAADKTGAADRGSRQDRGSGPT